LDGIEQVLWPDHAVQGTWGSQFHENLDLKAVDLFIRKGQNPKLDSYSAFFENDKKTETGLHYYLDGLNITDLYFVGLAWDYCVYFSAMDARQLGYNCFLLQEGSKGVDFPEGNVSYTTQEMKNAGVKIISHEQLAL
jgi:nicotinamidase/pyrazinamidase